MLTPERIDAEAFARWGEMRGAPLAMCRGFARAIEAEVRKDDEALIRQMLEALETGHEAAMQVAAEFHASYKGHRPDTHAALDADVDQIAKALAAARARLIDSDLSKLTERGAKAWAGVDPQKLREGGAP